MLSSGLRYQQICDIDLNLQDMKNKHWTVLFGFWLLLAFRVHAFNISVQVWEPEVLIFANWELRYYSGRCREWGRNLLKHSRSIVGLPAQAAQMGQWVTYSTGKSWELNRAAASRPSVELAGLVQECRPNGLDSRNCRSLTPSVQL